MGMMRNEQEMLKLIVDTARADERIRAVVMNGSRANPNAPRDLFQDYDIVYIVDAVAPFKQEPAWIERFGEMMILQIPSEMEDPPPSDDDGLAYLMQFADGNRIDLTLYPVARMDEFGEDSLSILLLDKDGLIGSFPPAHDGDYLPKPPTAKQFADCCNEFWWVSTYVAKGLWRQEIIYAKAMMDEIVRAELMKMLAWHIAVKTQFTRNPGKNGKYFERYLEPELWTRLLQTYADPGYENTWQALLTMGQLFRQVAVPLAEHFGYEYPHDDDRRVYAHLQHVRTLPRDAKTIY